MTLRTEFSAHVSNHPGPSTSVITKGGTFVSPEAGTNVAVWRAPFPCTATALRALTKGVGATPCVVNARRGTTDTLAGSNISITNNNEWTGATTLQNAKFSTGDTLELMYVSGSPPASVSIQVDFVVP